MPQDRNATKMPCKIDGINQITPLKKTTSGRAKEVLIKVLFKASRTNKHSDPTYLNTVSENIPDATHHFKRNIFR